tara:strand:+ start:104 stop:328 length:225 start_codon:yes stop_codon:yes gene_type:complete
MKFPFRYGQKVCFKKRKNNKYGFVRSYGPARLGNPDTTGIPGGPIVFETMVLVEWRIKGKYYICLEYVDKLRAC